MSFRLKSSPNSQSYYSLVVIEEQNFFKFTPSVPEKQASTWAHSRASSQFKYKTNSAISRCSTWGVLLAAFGKTTTENREQLWNKHSTAQTRGSRCDRTCLCIWKNDGNSLCLINGNACMLPIRHPERLSRGVLAMFETVKGKLCCSWAAHTQHATVRLLTCTDVQYEEVSGAQALPWRACVPFRLLLHATVQRPAWFPEWRWRPVSPPLSNCRDKKCTACVHAWNLTAATKVSPTPPQPGSPLSSVNGRQISRAQSWTD